MNPPNRLPAGVLATVLVVSALMLLSVLGVLALWESDFLFFSRAGYLSRQRANVESAFVLYVADSTLTARLDEQGGLRLYDGLPDSRVRIAVRPWGLYEAVRVEAADSRIAPTRLFGSAAPFACLPGEESGLWYATDAASLSLAGRTSLHGCLRLPRHGVQYGQIRSVFFCGERIEGARTAYAGKELPPVRTDARRMTDSLLRLLEAPGAWMPTPDSLSVGFGEAEPRMLDAGKLRTGNPSRRHGRVVRGDHRVLSLPRLLCPGRPRAGTGSLPVEGAGALRGALRPAARHAAEGRRADRPATRNARPRRRRTDRRSSSTASARWGTCSNPC